MKKLFTLFFAILLAFNANSQVSFCENFDALIAGDPIAETSSSWNTWDELMNGATAPFIDDALVSSIQSVSGSNSLHFPGSAAAGPEDVVLMFDPTLNITQSNLSSLSTPYVVGDFTFSQMMYIRSVQSSNGGAYFNFQALNTLGQTAGIWALEVEFIADPNNPTDPGTIDMRNTNGTLMNLPFSYPMNIWFEIKFEIDLSNNDWEVFIDGVSQGSFANTINQIASLDLYPNINHEYYVDDVCYSYVPATLFTNNGQVSNISTISGLTGQTRYPSVEIRNFGTDPIYSCDVTFDYNGTQMTENLTNIGAGFGLLSLTSMQVDFLNSITLISGTNIGTATISNVNGALQDDNPSDDVMTTQVVAITPTPNKLVIGEEATGTWCGWCPRGAVALNYMDRDYHGYFQGIAVHNGDPMTNPDYDAGLGPYIGGYPSALVDRGSEIDPSDFEQYFIQKIVDPISATFTGTASSTGNVIDVEISTTVTSAISGNWTFACVLVEDSVTGTGGTWYQSNSYGANGITLIDVDGTDWGTLPNWVPDVQMIYRHVGREIQPSFGGGSLPNATYNVGNVFTQNFQFTTDPTWDLNSMHVVGILLNNGMVDNAVSIQVINNSLPLSWDCVNGLCVDPGTGNGQYPSLVNCEAACINASVENVSPTTSLNIFPNPANSTTTLLITLDTEKEVSISVKSIEGKLIAKGVYGTMIGSHSSTFDVSDFANGVYIIEAIIGNEVIVKKFIKE